MTGQGLVATPIGRAGSYGRNVSKQRRPSRCRCTRLIVDDEVVNRKRQLLALPAALTESGRVGFIRGCRRASRSNCVCGGPEVVSSDVRHDCGLSRGKRREPRCTGDLTRRSIRCARDHFRLTHSHLAADPGACRIDRLTGTVVIVTDSLEVVQDMLGADGGPQREK